jgi:ADP-heptose:LPS heptosyltransferase/GT2 family glycosyltransferase
MSDPLFWGCKGCYVLPARDVALLCSVGEVRSWFGSRDGIAVTILFGEYELLATSGLFDAEYYVKSNPDIAALNVDPLLHYLEQGCRERRNPSASFDTSYYLSLCNALGETPDNPLAHYLTVGISRGLTPNPRSKKNGNTAAERRPAARAEPTSSLVADPGLRDDSPRTAVSMLHMDIPRVVGGRVEAPVQGGLSIVGWCLGAGEGAGIDIAVDGIRVTSARYGMRRPDVEAAHPDREDSLLSGYAAHLPPKVLPVGDHQVTVTLRNRHGEVVRLDFSIDVQKFATDRGPCTLRRKMTQAAIAFQLSTLVRLQCSPTFRVYLPFDPNAAGIAAVRRTLESLARQTYSRWELWLIPGRAKEVARIARTARRGTATIVSEITLGREDLARQIHILGGKVGGPGAGRRKKSAAPRDRCFVARLAAGDEFGCDALVEFALASAFERSAELFYSDERRLDPVDGHLGAFLKPAWSPDLHLSTNYLGRAWCADGELLERVGIGDHELGEMGDYEMSLRLAEAAKRIGHIPKVLYQRADGGGDSAKEERRALKDALRRRRIDGEIHAGCLGGHYRVKRKLIPGRVSIIIPTCAADGLIKVCLESLRARTEYRDYEIICIENIPKQQQDWKDWLRLHADIVIETSETFNWSRYNNQAAKRAVGRYLLFLNDDIEIIDPDWLGTLLEQAQRPEVGVVGPLLLYPDRSVQQAGVMLDAAGRGRHAFRHLSENDPGYFGLALTQRNVIAVTGACLLTRRETFATLGGFDEAHAVINNDLDYCLRAWRSNLINVYVPHAKLIHHELASRGRLEENYDVTKFNTQWRDVIAVGDPYFNPNLSRDHEPFTIEREPFEVVHAGHPVFAGSSVRRILVVKLDHIGDCITALPALRRLKHHFPAARISVLAARSTLAIWKSEPLVDEAIEFNFFHARSGSGKVAVTEEEIQLLTKRLHAKGFDLAIDLRKQPDTRHALEYSGAGILAGFDTQGRFPWLDVALEWDEDVPLRTKHGHVADDLVALVDTVAARSDPDRHALLTRPKGGLALPAAVRRRLFSKPLICIHPAAGSPMRQWPPAGFAELIHLFLRRKSFNVALIGGADEMELADRVLELAGCQSEVVNLVGRLALEDLPKLLADSVLFVGNNSGPHHLAAGLGVPTVGIHSGVVDAREWGPLGPRAVAVRRDMSCSPCFIEHEKDCPRKLECLKELSVADVYRACERML